MMTRQKSEINGRLGAILQSGIAADPVVAAVAAIQDPNQDVVVVDRGAE